MRSITAPPSITSATTTLAPCAARASAKLAPMPRAPPVTIATFSFNRCKIDLRSAMKGRRVLGFI
jgi:hypothetical protein